MNIWQFKKIMECQKQNKMAAKKGLLNITVTQQLSLVCIFSVKLQMLLVQFKGSNTFSRSWKSKNNNTPSKLIFTTGHFKRFIHQIDSSDCLYQKVKLTYVEQTKTSLAIFCCILECYTERFDKSDIVFNALAKVLELYPQAEAAIHMVLMS